MLQRELNESMVERELYAKGAQLPMAIENAKGVWIRDPDTITKKRHGTGYDGFILFNGIVIFVEVKVEWRRLSHKQICFQEICREKGIRHFVLRYFPKDRSWMAIDPNGGARKVRSAAELVLMLQMGVRVAAGEC